MEKTEYFCETTIDSRSADQIVTALRTRKLTGKVTLHLSQGTIQKVVLVEKVHVEEKLSGLQEKS